ncbi:MAG: GDSL family lipase [Cephaloticoccus sp.]|nr:GDSL family lipase [Cephaloticoccus sp.]MCF7759269.1 GDSL family lipase [Cephaloticoccus sp.]
MSNHDQPETAQPIPKTGNEAFFLLHESYVARAQAGRVGLLFLGDSITLGWQSVPHIWEHYYGAYQPARFGIGGDGTQHVIWRIVNGELDGISPKVVVLLIGCNNCSGSSAADIAAGIREIIRLIHAKIPTTKILVLGIFPRGPRTNADGSADDWASHMAKIRTVNADLAALDNGGNIRVLDITPHFRGNDGTTPKSIMPDQVHLSAAGYQIWAEAMHPLLLEMLQ